MTNGVFINSAAQNDKREYFRLEPKRLGAPAALPIAFASR
jgi:hypothetical protein